VDLIKTILGKFVTAYDYVTESQAESILTTLGTMILVFLYPLY